MILAVTELFHGTVHIDTLKWDFHLSHAVAIHPFLHMPSNNILTGGHQNTMLCFVMHLYSRLRYRIFCFPHHMSKYFLFFFFSFFYVGEGSSHILRLMQPNVPVWLWLRIRQIRGNLMKGRALVGFLFVIPFFCHNN